MFRINNPRGLKFGPDCHLYVAEAGRGVLGVADVAFIDNNLYALLWAGCSHEVPEVPIGNKGNIGLLR